MIFPVSKGKAQYFLWLYLNSGVIRAQSGDGKGTAGPNEPNEHYAKFQKLSDLGISFYDNPSEELKKKFEELDKNEVSGTKNDITFLACAELQNTIFNLKKEIERNENILDGINKYYSNGKLQKNLNRIQHQAAYPYTGGKGKSFHLMP